MKRLLFTIAIWLAPFGAYAQCNGVFPNNTVCGNVTGSANLPRPTPPSSFLGSAGGTNGQLQYNNVGALGGFTMAGDCVMSIPNITCTMTNGVPFSTVATSGLITDTTGNLPTNRLNSGTNATANTSWFGNGTWKPPSQGTGTYYADKLADYGLGLTNFACNSSTDDTPAWNAFMAATWAGTVPAFSTLSFENFPRTSYCRMSSRPSQWGKSLKIVGNAWFLRNYQPGQLVRITNTANNGAGLIRITVVDTSIFTNGQTIGINNVQGTNEANGLWTISIINGTTIDLIADPLGRPSAYTNGFAALAVSNAVNAPAGTCVSTYGACIRLTTSAGAGAIAYNPVNVVNVGGVTNANGQKKAIIVSDTVIDVEGIFTGSYTVGGVVYAGSAYTAPLEPFIEVGPQSNTDFYSEEASADHLLIYAGDGTYGGIGLDFGSFNINGTGYGAVAYSQFRNISISGSFSGRFGVQMRYDGSNSPGNPVGSFSGTRLNHLQGYFAASGYWAGLWIRGAAGWNGLDIFNTGAPGCVSTATLACTSPGTALLGDLLIDGTTATLSSYSMSILGGSTQNLVIGPNVNTNIIQLSGINQVIFTDATAAANMIAAGFCTTAPTMLGTNNQVMCNATTYTTSGPGVSCAAGTLNPATAVVFRGLITAC